MDRAKPTAWRSRAAERLIWTGSALAGLSVMSVVLSSIYRSLEGLEHGFVMPRQVWVTSAFLAVIGLGAILVLAGLVLGRTPARGRLDRSVESRPDPEPWEAKIAV